MKLATAEVIRTQEELTRQRAHSLKLEDFLRRITSNSTRYVLDPAVRKEALAILASAVRLRTPGKGTLYIDDVGKFHCGAEVRNNVPSCNRA